MDMTWGRLHGQVSFKIDKYLSNIPRSTSARERPEGPWGGIGGHYLSEIRGIQMLVQIRYIQMSINMVMFLKPKERLDLRIHEACKKTSLV